MKPTTEQQEFLSKYLNKNLRYRETYTEFYDHILSALETKPDNMPFQDAVESIVTEDFGGFEGMSVIEARYQKATMKEMRKKYVDYIIDYLKFPSIGITAALAMVFYWMILQPWFGFFVFLGVIFGMRLVPGLIKGIRHFRAGYTFNSIKKSVKDNVFAWLDFAPGTVLSMFAILYYSFHKNNSPIEWFKNAYPATLTIILLICAIHTLSYYKVYQNEFKASITR